MAAGEQLQDQVDPVGGVPHPVGPRHPPGSAPAGRGVKEAAEEEGPAPHLALQAVDRLVHRGVLAVDLVPPAGQDGVEGPEGEADGQAAAQQAPAAALGQQEVLQNLQEQQGGQDEAAGQQVPHQARTLPRRWAEEVSAAAKVAGSPTTQPRAIFRS